MKQGSVQGGCMFLCKCVCGYVRGCEVLMVFEQE